MRNILSITILPKYWKEPVLQEIVVSMGKSIEIMRSIVVIRIRIRIRIAGKQQYLERSMNS